MLLKPCNKCGAMIRYPLPYCAHCQALVDQANEQRRQANKRARDKAYNQRRNPIYTRFYNSKEWRTLSAVYLQDRRYKCERCGRLATEVHHKDYIQTASGWDRRLDYDNLEALCTDCHNKEHGRFNKKKK